MHDITTSPAQRNNAHVKGFVTSYAKCWDHYQAYMQDPNNTYKGFVEACKEEAKAQGIEIQLPAANTFLNRTAKLVQAGAIPERAKSDKPEAVRQRKHRASVTNPRIGEMSQPTTTDTTNDPDPRLDPQPVPVRTALCTVVPDLEPLAEATVVEDGTCIPMGTYEQQQGHADYLEASRLVNQLATLFERNAFQPRMLPEHWRSLHGGLRGLVETAEVQTRYSARVLEG